MEKNLKLMECIKKPQWLSQFKTKSWWDNIYYDVRRCMLNIPSFYHDCIYGFKNIVKFLPVIWRYRHWDFEYILDILIKTLEIHKNGILQYGIAINTDKVAKEIEDSIQDIKSYLKYSENFEKENQDLLYKIKNSENDDAVREYFSKLSEFEKEKWDNIFDNLKKNMRNWWD